VATATEKTVLSSGGLSDSQRLRLMLDGSLDRFRLEVAYEHLASLWQREGGPGSILFPTAGTGGTGWLDLEGVIKEGDHGRWSHRLDRLLVATDLGGWGEARIGRQAISWSTTLFLTPADPFAPFDPADPFREYRVGVDAFRAQAFPGPFSEIDFVVRPAEVEDETTWTALVRGRHSLANWDVSGWAGMIHDEFGVAVATSGAIGSWALRGEASLRKAEGEDGSVVRAALGVDHLAIVRNRDLFFLAELQYDGFGAESAEKLLQVLQSNAFARGEMQVIGDLSALTQTTYQLHPLVGVDALVILNPRDWSGLFAPGVAWSAASEASVRAGVYLGWGDDELAGRPVLPSEYGLTPATGYLSLTWFF
jgi:hypothetical protein